MYKGTMNAVVNARCPYFNREYKTTISCEGLVKNTEITMKFESPDEKDEQIRTCCTDYPNECPLAQKLDEKYENGEQ